MDFLADTFYGNTVRDWLEAVAVTLGAYAVLRIIALVVVARLGKLAEKTKLPWDDIFIGALKKTRTILLLIVAAYAGGQILLLPDRARTILESVTIIALLVQTGIWISAGIRQWVQVERERREDDPATVMSMSVLGVAARLVAWAMVVLLILDNLGVDVTALVAGLGIGGIAVALAAQNILGDLFASLSIVLDKPFVLGDFLVVGSQKGSVETIGLKTTRLRSLTGEQLVVSNADLLNSRISNFGRLYERRASFSIGVTYQTPREALERVPGMIQEAIEAHGDQVRFDRAHLKSFGDFAIVFEAVYHVLAPEYGLFMDIQQAVNLTLHERFEADGIEFAYPTQTLFLEKAES